MRVGTYEIEISFAKYCSLGEVRSNQARLLKSVTIRNVRGNAEDWLKISGELGGIRLNAKRISGYLPGTENPVHAQRVLDGLLLPPELTPGIHNGTLLLMASAGEPVTLSFSVTVLPSNMIPVDYFRAKYLAAWVRSDEDLRSFVRQCSIDKSDIPELTPRAKLETLYEALQKKELFYQPCPPPIYEDHQQIGSLDYIMKRGGNCAELSILFASLLYSWGENPVLLLFSDHMAVGCLTADSSAPVTVNETDEILSMLAQNQLCLTDATGVCVNCRRNYSEAEFAIADRLRRSNSCVLIHVVQALRTGGVKPVGEIEGRRYLRCPNCGCDEVPVSSDDEECICPACGQRIPTVKRATPGTAVTPPPQMQGKLRFTLQGKGASVSFVQPDDTVEFVVPAYWRDKPVLEIGSGVFSRSSMRSMVLPEGMMRIGSRAFSGCKKLCSIALPSTLCEIGPGAFAESGLQAVMIPGSVRKIGVGAFRDCSDLKQVILEHGLQEIGDNAFLGCPVLFVEIPASVQKISRNAFDQNCQLILLSDKTLVE